MTELNLWSNNLTGALPPELGALADLRSLYLGDNQLTGAIPAQLGRLAKLEELNLLSNQLTGAIPAELGRLAELEVLSLWENELTGPIPAELGRLAELEVLSLWENELTGAIPAELGRLANLRGLNLRSNQLTGIPAALGGLTNLEGLSLSHNQLTGGIPAELGRLSSLKSLNLRSNQLTGAIPPGLGGLTNLRTLHLGSNQLTGAIPPGLGGLTNLEALHLDWNQLTGAIPADLGGLVNLLNLGLGSNRLSGSLPPELGNLANLRSLTLAFNIDLSGALPLPLQPPLRWVDLHFTQLCVPPADAAFEAWAATAGFDPSGLTCGVPPPGVSAIDVAVFYTPAARRGQGGTAAIEAVIDLMIAETNQAYRDGGVNQRVVLAAREEVQYTEAARAGVDLHRLQARSDGYMDEVHTIRDRVGADLVHLVSAPRDVDGQAFLPSRAGSAFALTHHRRGAEVFVHEMGHNMGLQHDRYAACGYRCANWPTPYSYGYVNQRAFSAGVPAPARRWFTIMAYPDHCRAEGVRCQTLLRFSNPTQMWNGDPLGVPGDLPSHRVDGPSDAVRALNNARHAVAAFRDPPANRPPQPDARLPDRVLDAGAVVVELASAFWDPDGDVLTYGATSSAPTVATAVVSGSRVTVTRVAPGRATVTVTATDPGGLRAVQTFTVRSPNRPPVAVGTLPDRELGLPGVLEVDVSAAFEDPDGDALTYAVSSSAPDVVRALARWPLVVLLAEGRGAAEILVTATDPGGLSAMQTFTVTVPDPNQPPEAVGMLAPLTVGVGEGPVSVEVSGAFRDPDGDALTYEASSSAPSVATVSVSASTVTVTAVAPGTSTVVVSATDTGGSNTAALQRFTVTVRNQPPEAVGTLAPLTIGVGEAAARIEVSGAFRDPDGDALTYEASSSAPSVATVSVSVSTVTVTAVAPGTSTVTVTATDTDGSNTAATQAFTVKVPTPFTDHPIVPGETPIKALHFTELRTGIDVLRREAGLPPYRWTDPVLTAGVTRVRLVHLLELREALAAAYVAAGRSAPVWTDAELVGGATAIRAAHLMELRAAVRARE